MAKAKVWFWSQATLDQQLSMMYRMNRTNYDLYDINWKCEGHVQVTDVETVQVSAVWQGIVSVVYGNVFWRKILTEAMII